VFSLSDDAAAAAGAVGVPTDPAEAAALAVVAGGLPAVGDAAAAAAAAADGMGAVVSSSSFKSPRLQQLLQLRELFMSRGINLAGMGLAIRDTGREEGERLMHAVDYDV
jgi:hypothetical protein